MNSTGGNHLPGHFLRAAREHLQRSFQICRRPRHFADYDGDGLQNVALTSPMRASTLKTRFSHILSGSRRCLRRRRCGNAWTSCPQSAASRLLRTLGQKSSFEQIWLRKNQGSPLAVEDGFAEHRILSRVRDLLAEVNQLTRPAGKLPLKINFTTKILHVGVPGPRLADSFIGEIFQLLSKNKPAIKRVGKAGRPSLYNIL